MHPIVVNACVVDTGNENAVGDDGEEGEVGGGVEFFGSGEGLVHWVIELEVPYWSHQPMNRQLRKMMNRLYSMPMRNTMLFG